jgi:hypothetical protein
MALFEEGDYQLCFWEGVIGDLYSVSVCAVMHTVVVFPTNPRKGFPRKWCAIRLRELALVALNYGGFESFARVNEFGSGFCDNLARRRV